LSIDQPQPPTCPRCGAHMVLRTARRGRSAGGRFYGCSRYPACKEIVNLAIESGRIASIAPRELVARPRSERTQCRYYQTIALPDALVQEINDFEVEGDFCRALAQWRLDFPLPRASLSDERMRSVLSVAEAILTRGTITLCSPKADGKLMEALGSSALAQEELLDAVRSVSGVPTCRFEPADFDSDEERLFSEWAAKATPLRSPAYYLAPQVQLSSLTGQSGDATGTRGDFVLSHLERDTILVEIDGAAHGQHKERDQGRDAALLRAGVRVIRVPAAEVRAGAGPEIDSVAQVLRGIATDAVADSLLTMVLRTAKYVHQVQIALLEAVKTAWLPIDSEWRIGVVSPEILGSSGVAPPASFSRRGWSSVSPHRFLSQQGAKGRGAGPRLPFCGPRPQQKLCPPPSAPRDGRRVLLVFGTALTNAVLEVRTSKRQAHYRSTDGLWVPRPTHGGRPARMYVL